MAKKKFSFRKVYSEYRSDPWMRIIFLSFVLLTLLTLFVLARLIGCGIETGIEQRHCSLNWQNFYVAWIQDYSFFLVVGILSLVVTYRRLGILDFEQRVKALANSSGAKNSEGLYEFLLDRIKELGAFFADGEVEIDVREFNPAKDYYKVAVTCRYKVVNLFNDKDYKRPLPYPKIVADVVEGKKLIGQVTEAVHIFPKHAEELGGDNIIVNPRSPQDLTPKDPSFQPKPKEDAVLIPSDETIIYKYSYWILNKIGSQQYVYFARFTEKVDITVTNTSGINLKFVDGKGDTVALKDGSTVEIISNGTFKEDERFSFSLEKTR